jgi:hypothetical protein
MSYFAQSRGKWAGDGAPDRVYAWIPWLSTSERRDKVNPEHIHLYWDRRSPAVMPPCRNTECTLAAARR